MKANREDLFRQIEPPPGGAERLSARLAAAPSPRTSLALRLTAAGGVAAVALAAAVQLHERFHPPAPAPGDLSDLSASPEFDRLLGREPRPYELTVSVDGDRVPVVEVPTSDPGIRLYALRDR